MRAFLIIFTLTLSAFGQAAPTYEVHLQAGQNPALIQDTVVYCEGAKESATSLPDCVINKVYRTSSDSGFVSVRRNGQYVDGWKPTWNSDSSFQSALQKAQALCERLQANNSCVCKY